MAQADDASKHILVVNDTEEIIELFRDILEGMGHRCSAMSFAPDDLSAVSQAKPDLVILDLLINGETQGWQLAQKMRMSPETASIPIIICTALTDVVREQEGWLTAKAIKVVPKPFSVQELERAVTKGLELPALVLGNEALAPALHEADGALRKDHGNGASRSGDDVIPALDRGG